MNMFARFDENPAMTLEDIKETKRYVRTDARTHAHTDGQRENSIPTTNKDCGGIMKWRSKIVCVGGGGGGGIRVYTIFYFDPKFDGKCP